MALVGSGMGDISDSLLGEEPKPLLSFPLAGVGIHIN